MLSITEKYKVFCADLSKRGFGSFGELLEIPLKKVEEFRALSVLQEILSGGN